MNKNSRSELESRGLRPKKSFGQNFMMDQQINARFAAAADTIACGAPVVEIGAGAGSLTEHLLKITKVVHAIERDRDLIPVLREKFAEQIDSGNLILHEADGARFDLRSIFCEESPGVIVGNLPYHLTSSITLLALRNHAVLKGAVFLVQKEVGDRLAAGPHNKDYGFLTVVLNLGFDITTVCNVHRDSFWPIPRVDSVIISLKAVDRGISKINNFEEYLHFVRQFFQKRRKKLSTIVKGLTQNLDLDLDLARVGIDGNLRPENLTPQQFLLLFLSVVHRNC